VKLDKSFIDGVCTAAGDRAIVAAGIGLAQALQAVTVAEGVETADQAAALRELGCELAQGYLFARPTPGEELGELFGMVPGPGAPRAGRSRFASIREAADGMRTPDQDRR